MLRRLEAALAGPSRRGLLVRARPGEGGYAGARTHLRPNPYQAPGVRGRRRPGGPLRPIPLLLAVSGCASSSALESYRSAGAPCHDRSLEPVSTVVDAHLHFRPFGGPEIPFGEVVSYLEETGVLFANVYGIGQTLPDFSSCTYYLDCPGTPLIPSLDNDLANAAEYLADPPSEIHLTLSMTFPDLSRPASVLAGMERLDEAYPGVFSWMGEVNLVKQAVFPNGRRPVPEEVLAEWAPFMETLRERGMPLAIHSDLGHDDDPTLYLSLMEEVLRLYPDNRIVWMHMGLSRELAEMDPHRHVAIMRSMLDRYPRLMLDISWRVIDDAYFSDAARRAVYVPFLNEYSERILPGTDFLASREKDVEVYRTELRVTSRILGHLDDAAFRNIALGENYFRLLGLDYTAPRVCGGAGQRGPGR